MTNFKIKLANKIFDVTATLESTKEFCKEYLVDLDGSDFIIKVDQSLIDEEKRIQLSEGEYKVTDLPDDYLEPLALYRRIVEVATDFSTLMFHSSVVSIDGQAFAFAALSGTGKSTHTRLWREYFKDRAIMVNDDKPLITINEGGAVVHGTPWNGKHNIGNNITVPLHAICILERGANNSIKRISKKEAFPMLYQQTYRSKNPKTLIKILSLIEKLADNVELYKLSCNMDVSAAMVSYQGMTKGEKL